MTTDVALQLMHEMLWTALWVSAPIIGVSMLVGLLVSVFQVVTQLQEMTLTFVPKLVAIFFTLLLGGGWMLSKLVVYSSKLIASIPQLIH
jgi:flagellar biosynthetic protein FliQ